MGALIINHLFPVNALLHSHRHILTWFPLEISHQQQIAPSPNVELLLSLLFVRRFWLWPALGTLSVQSLCLPETKSEIHFVSTLPHSTTLTSSSTPSPSTLNAIEQKTSNIKNLEVRPAYPLIIQSLELPSMGPEACPSPRGSCPASTTKWAAESNSAGELGIALLPEPRSAPSYPPTWPGKSQGASSGLVCPSPAFLPFPESCWPTLSAGVLQRVPGSPFRTGVQLG